MKLENQLLMSTIPLVQILSEIVLFLVLTWIGIFIVKNFPKNNSKFLKPNEYLPDDKIQTLKQVDYLVLMGACFIDMMYPLIFVNSNLMYLTVFDIILSLYIAINIDKSTIWRKLILLFLVPYGSLTFLLYNSSSVILLNLIHIPVFIYFIKYYYDRFKEYTESHGLGIAVILVFVIVFISFIITAIMEHKNPLDALVMVSNAFTSNGYTVQGSTVGGKMNSILLVWSGFILSSVGTATMASAILTRHINSKFKGYDEKIDKLNDKLDETNAKLDNLEKLIRNNQDD